MNYKEQLESKEWKEKRIEILERDNFRCRKCNVERSVFVGLSPSFKIKSYFDLKNEGYSYIKKFKEIGVSLFKNKLLNIADYIDKDDISIDVKELFFALKWKSTTNKYSYFCFSKEKIPTVLQPDLNVHHKYYIENKLAWEYENDALITLCVNCHMEEHEKNKIPIINKNGDTISYPKICDRCAGTGYLPQYHFYFNGICFRCWGNGVCLE